MDTLVLSQSYEPVARVDWKRAVTLLFEGKVEVVEEYENWEVRSVTVAIKVPSVIRFLKNAGRKKRGVKFSRDHVYARDHGSCQYCGNRVPRPEATYDHVQPRVAGGHTRWENIVIACSRCNQKKGGRTPAQAGMRLIACTVPGCTNHNHPTPVKPKKLPGGLNLTFTWQKGMPESWRSWLRDAAASVEYWHGELEQD